MKYILFIFSMLCLCSCLSDKEQKALCETENAYTYVKQFKYKDHNYIKFGRGVVHNPDCPCYLK